MGRVRNGYRATVGLAAVVVVVVLISNGTVALVIDSGYFNDAGHPTIRNGDFSVGVKGTDQWLVEQGTASKYATYYRSAPNSLRMKDGALVKIRQDVSSASIGEFLGRPMTFTFWFRTLSGSVDSARGEIWWMISWYDSVCRCTRTRWSYAIGAWIGSSTASSANQKWTSVSVTGTVSWDAVAIYVRVVIDDLSGSSIDSLVEDAQIYRQESVTAASSYGKGAMTVAVWRVQQAGTLVENLAEFSVALAADADGVYSVQALRIQVFIEPTTQNGDVFVRNLGEANDEGWAVNPADQQRAEETGLLVAEVAVGIILAAATAGLGAGYTSFAVGSAASTGTTLLFSFLGEKASERHDITAVDGDLSTSVIWDYGGLGVVDRAVASHEVDWFYDRLGTGSYRVRIVGTITWGVWNTVCGYRGGADWTCWYEYQIASGSSLVQYVYV